MEESSNHMRLNVLGTLTSDASADELRCAPRTALLLASLAFADGAVSRSALLERLWPAIDGEIPRARSDGNLDGYATKARALLNASGRALHANKGTRTLTLYRPGTPAAEAVLPTDIWEFQQLRRSHHASNLEAGLALVRGPVLASLDEHTFPWLKQVRQRLNSDCVYILRQLFKWPSERAETLVASFMETPSGTLLETAQASASLASEESTLLDSDSLDAFLASHYRPDSPSLRTLTQLVIPAPPPYYDADITLQLRDSKVTGKYELTYRLEITAQLDDFIMALTTRASLTDLLLAECPDISDSFTCSDETGRKDILRALRKPDPPIAVWCLESAPNGVTRRTPIALPPLTEIDSTTLLRQLDADSSRDVILLRGKLPGAKGAPRRISYRVRDSNMSIGEHYAFWVADRPIFVRRIVIDATQFVPTVHVHPMIGNIAHELEWNDQCCDTLVNNWVVKNQGIFLSW